MYYLTDICLLCLKNNMKLQSVLNEDNDGIVFIEKIRSCYSEIIDSIPDTHKLACFKCLEKLRFLYDFQQNGIRNNSVIENYLETLQCENKTRQKPAIILAARKRRRKLPSSANCSEIKIENVENNFKLKIQNLNLNSMNGVLNTVDHSCQPTKNENVPYNCGTEEKNVEIKNEETDVPVTEAETVNVKQELQFSVDGYSTNSLDEEVSEGTCSKIKDNINIEIVRDDSSTLSDYNNQKEITIFNNLSSNDSLEKSVINKKFCKICRKLLFKDLNNINLHLNVHISNCSRCRESIEVMCTFQRHLLIHCTFVPKILNNNEYWKKFSCAICTEQFDNFNNLKLHINIKHTATFNCEICSKSFPVRVHLVRHIWMTHCRVKIIRCKICTKQFTSKESFEDHMIYQHFGGQVCICKYCKQTFTILNELGEHILRSHDSSREAQERIRMYDRLEKGDEVTENNTDAATESEKNYINGTKQFSDEDVSSNEESEDDNHKRKKYSSTIQIAEEESNSRTSNSSDLNQQTETPVTLTATTNSEVSYCEPDSTFNISHVCATCQKMFFYLINLSEHLNAHMQESCCSMCKDSAENISRLQRHMLTPCGNKNTTQNNATTTNERDNDKVTCVVCRQEFYFYILRKHMYNHIIDLTCVVCQKSFREKNSLHRHLMYHCNLKPFQCEVCSRKYTTKESLKYHVDSKHTSKVAVCQYCHKKMQCPKTLREHIKKLHPNVTFKCEVCKKNFVHKNELEKHAKLHN